jgi:hypothetical protein
MPEYFFCFYVRQSVEICVLEKNRMLTLASLRKWNVPRVSITITLFRAGYHLERARKRLCVAYDVNAKHRSAVVIARG